jgi:hypothetical protein
MKYAITGHTYGIGLEIFNRLSPNIKGFSRTNGFDINSYENRKQIILESLDADVFINNAQNKFGQTLMFIDLWEAWKDKENKIIINVGSRIADIKILPSEKTSLMRYQAEKVILKEMSSRVEGKCSVKYVSFGYVGTENILKKYPNIKDYISVESAASIILNAV